MRPVPKARHFVALAICALVSIGAGVFAALEDHLSDDQANMAVNVVRASDDALYKRDSVFSADGLYRLHNPVWKWYLREVYRAGADEDVMLPFQILIGPMVFAFLAGMYGLLWRQTGSWSVACYGAVLSTAVIPLAAGAFWGLGPLETATPATVVIALTPLVLWAFVARWDSPSVLWVFLALGMAGNLHFCSAMNLALVLAIVLIGRCKLHWRAWAKALAGLACAVGAASPILWYYAAQQAALGGGASWPVFGWTDLSTTAAGAVGVLSPALEFPSLAYLLALIIPAAAVTIRSERFWVRNMAIWVWMILATLVVALIGSGLDRVSGATASAHLAHAIRFLPAPLYVLWTQAVVHLFRSGIARHALRGVLVAVMGLWLAPADNLAVPRHWLQEAGSRALAFEERPENVQNRLDRAERRGELRAICDWLRRHSDGDALVACTQPHARLWSRRSLTACWTDRPYYDHASPQRLADWQERFNAQNETLMPRRGGPADPRAIEMFARRYGIDYVILQAQAAPTAVGPGAWVSDDLWGEHWRLYRPAGGPASPIRPAEAKDGGR